jgi:hypothetical protein
MMLTEVLATAPSRIALATASSELRRTLDWPASIPKVLQAIREQEVRWRYRLSCACALAQEHAKARSKLQEIKVRFARPAADRKAEREERLERLEKLKQLLKAGAAKHGA